MEILSRLVSKQVAFSILILLIVISSLYFINLIGECLQIWKYPKLWVGFLKCTFLTKPQSFGVLLQVRTCWVRFTVSTVTDKLQDKV